MLLKFNNLEYYFNKNYNDIWFWKEYKNLSKIIQPAPGEHTLTIVDEDGAAISTSIMVIGRK
jgi:hypothetical protein